MVGLKDEKRRELVSIGYTAGDLADRSKKALETNDNDVMIERILKNQIFILKVFNGLLTELE